MALKLTETVLETDIDDFQEDIVPDLTIIGKNVVVDPFIIIVEVKVVELNVIYEVLLNGYY